MVCQLAMFAEGSPIFELGMNLLGANILGVKLGPSQTNQAPNGNGGGLMNSLYGMQPVAQPYTSNAPAVLDKLPASSFASRTSISRGRRSKRTSTDRGQRSRRAEDTIDDGRTRRTREFKSRSSSSSSSRRSDDSGT